MLEDQFRQIPKGIFNFPPCFRHVRIVVENDYSFLHHCSSTWHNAAPTGRIFMKCDILGFSENALRKFSFRYSLTKIAYALYEVLCTFMIISRIVHLRMRYFRGKLYVKSKHTFYVQ
jgi:hypothetical protein